MGQLIEVEHLVLGDVALFDTDRSFSGQEGETYSDGATAAASSTYPGRVAAALFAAVPSLLSVYVFSNTVSVTRTGGWSTDHLGTAGEVIRNSLIHYESNRGGPDSG